MKSLTFFKIPYVDVKSFLINRVTDSYTTIFKFV